MKKLIHEIHRRSLWRVLGIYVVGSWVALQVVDVLANNFGLPGWFPAFALALLVIGLPIVLATAFVQEGMAARGVPEDDGEIAAQAAPRASAGRHRLLTWRNAIGGGVAAFALWGVIAAGWLVFGPGVENGGGEATDEVVVPDVRSVAVLPFATRAREGDEDAVIFAEGMHDDLLTQLSKIESLKVISRTTMVRYADSELSIPEIAAELGVATVLEGGVQRAGDRVRVNVQLIDARTDEHLWGETYDQQLSVANVFAIQSDLAQKIAGALKARLTPETEMRIEALPTESLEAFDLYSRARYIFDGPRGASSDGLQEITALLQLAIAADSSYAQAWVLLARTYRRQWRQAFRPPEEALPAARAAVEHALELNASLSAAHSAHGDLLVADLRYDEAEASYLRALELNPGSAEAHQAYSFLLRQLERHDEAVEQARRAVELDPMSVAARSHLVSRLSFARDWAGTVQEARKLIEMEPNEPSGYYYVGWGQAMLGEVLEAIEAYGRAHDLSPEQGYYTAGLAWAWAKAGNRDSALLVVADVPEQGAMLKEIAIVYGALGEMETAYRYLNRAAEQDPGIVGELRTDPTAAPLRADSRWGELMRKIGLEQ